MPTKPTSAGLRSAEIIMMYLCSLAQGRYCDGACTNVGEGANHTSLHASAFPLAFKLVPGERIGSTVKWLRERGMACSVYGSFPLLEAEYGATAVDRNTTSATPEYLDYGAAATALLTSCETGENSSVGFGSWCGMIRQNATCAMEAWNPRQKPNLSFSHPGATAALIAIVEGFFGIRALEPSYASFIVQPQPGSVRSASIRLPTLRGFIEASFVVAASIGATTSLELNVSIPANTQADLCIPAPSQTAAELVVDGTSVPAMSRAGYLCATDLRAGLRSVRPK